MFFFLKKLIGTLVMPLPLALLLSVAGGLLLALRHRKAEGLLVILALLGISLASWGPVADALLSPLESRYPPLLDASGHPEAVAVVVLGSGYSPVPGLPVTSQLSATALVRLAEGIRLYRQLPGAHLILSGGAVYGSGASAHGYARAARGLGVPASDLVLLDTPRDTAAEARAVRDLLGTKQPFILVTSAAHMPRAIRHFKVEGLNPVPAPTRYRSLREDRFRLRYWVPSARQLRKTERALYEYMGMLAVGLDR